MRNIVAHTLLNQAVKHQAVLPAALIKPAAPAKQCVTVGVLGDNVN